MKIRVTGLALAGLMAASVTLPAFAAVAEDSAAGQAAGPGIYLDGELAQVLEFQLYNGTNYITVESFMALMDEEAVVEKEEGAVTVSAFTVAEVVDVETEDDPQETPAEEPAQDAGQTDAETAASVQAQAGAVAAAAQDGESARQDAARTAQQAVAEDTQAQPGNEDAQEETSGDAEAEETPQANVVEETLTLSAATGQQYVVANDRYLYVEDGVKQLNGEVAVPVRVLAKIFNLEVGYDSATGNVTLTSQEESDAYLADGSAYYDSDALYWLSHIIYAESGNQPLAGKIAVGNVVMNRVASPLFPDTIYDVLFQRNQFSPAITGSIYRTPNAASVVAAKLVLDGAVVLENALFFNAVGVNSYASRNRPYVATIGNHAFYA